MKTHPVEVCVIDENIIEYDTNQSIPVAIEIPYSIAQLTSSQNICVVRSNIRNTTNQNMRNPEFLKRVCLVYMIILFFSIILFIVKM